MKAALQSLVAVVMLAGATQVAAQITLFSSEGLQGQSFTADQRVGNLQNQGFNDRASSVVVERGRWEVCEHARFEGRCIVLRRGSYPSLREMGLNDTISSVRPAEEAGRGGWRQDQNDERRQGQNDGWRQGDQGRRGPNVMPPPYTGSRRGDDLYRNLPPVTPGGIVVDRSAQATQGTFPAPVTSVRGSGERWDVTYVYDGVEYRIQMSAPPGPTVPIAPDGQPRITYRR